MEYRSLCWEDIEEGQALPPITYELSLLRLVAFVRATGLYDYVHFDRDYAQAVGTRDVFIATPHVGGLFSRLLTDWSGPEADIKSLSFSMLTQSCAGDILEITGKVGKKYRGNQGEYLVDLVDLNIGHKLAAHAATASATLVLPSREGGPVKLSGRAGQKPVIEPDPNMPDFAKSMLGKPKAGSWAPARPLTEDEIHLWCESLEDWNPLYWDKDYASQSRYGGLIAPYASTFFGAGSSVNVGLGYLKPGEKIPEPVQRGLVGLPLLQALREGFLADNSPFTLPDFPEVAVVLARNEYFKPLRPGDSMHTTLELLNCTPKKRTKLGEGHFLTYANSGYNQRNELVKTLAYTLFHYHA